MINFQPSEEQDLLRQTLAGFARDVVRPQIRESDEKSFVPGPIVEKGWELGLVQDAIPEALGGYGSPRSAIGGTFILEELAYGSLGIALHLVVPRLFTVPVLVAGTEAQKSAWLPKFAGPTFVAGTAAFTEPGWGFDPTALATKAERSGSEWTLTGEKCAVPLADKAHAILVYATAPDGLAAFVVEPSAKGLTIGEREKNMGVRALDTFGVKLDGVRVPATNRLGGDGTNLQPLVDAQRVASAAAAVGVGRAAFDYAREYAKERTAFGVPIATKQAIAFMLSNMAIEIDSMRLLAWEAAWRLDKEMPATREGYLAKQYAADAVLKIADNAVQVLGGHGYIRDHLVELFLRDARAFGTLDGLAIV
jgi:alkylation response protein AidB-like acyl-CoA dehydrogenase